MNWLGACIGTAALLTGMWQPSAEEIIAELQKRFESFEAFSCEFAQSKNLRQLRNPIELEGSMTFQKPGLLRVEFRGDENYDVYANGEMAWLVDQDLQEVEAYPLGTDESARLLRLISPLTFLSPQEILARYDVISLAPERERYRLRLEPKAPEGVDAITLEIDGTYRTKWMRVDYEGGDWTETKFRGWKKHGAISRYFFEYRGR